MFEPKLISPMLDGFHMGAPISDHDGVQCCPAMKEDSENKYIVKIISIPASQVQLDALLLTGAYDDPGAAMDYFQELADGVAEEAKILKKLSKLEGFLPYDNWQIVPMEDNQLGYHVYLITSYKRSLEKYLRKNTMTRLGAVNLGLDMCSALAVARRAGQIYADLKPTNIFISDDKQFRIGDLGFLAIEGLKYTSLPSKYISDYTAPELKDALSTVNTTVDTYAVGMILYQIYNNGQLPTVTEEEALPAPVNADYELAEIILKACAWNPEERFADPMEMGRELVAYMQRNQIDDTPITPPPAEVSQEAEPLEQVDETAPTEADAEDITDAVISEETASMVEQADDLAAHEIPAPAVAPDPVEIKLPEPIAETPVETSDSPAEPEESQIEDALPQEMPVLENREKPVKKEKKAKQPKPKKEPKKKKGGMKAVLLLLIVALLAGCGFIFFHEYYMQKIDAIHLDGQQNQLTVTLDTQTDNSLLTVTISDAYGNTKQSDVENNQAHFDGLLADSLYKIQVNVSGFRKVYGVSSHSYTTPAETKIESLTAKAGPEDGSVVLSFAVSGPDSDSWTVTATAEGETPISQDFTSHTVTVTGLSLGKTYTFTVEPAGDQFLVGENTVDFRAAAIVKPQDLKVANYGDGVMTVTWSIPEDVTVENWTVRCYNSNGDEKSQTVTETSATFTELDTTQEYTVEVLAAGMTEPSRTSVSANPTILSNIRINDQEDAKLVVTWDYTGVEPKTGWHVKYSVDGCLPLGIVEAKETSAVIQPRIPGATYEITIVPADGASAFENTITYDCPNAEIFSYKKAAISTNAISNNLRVNMLKRPAKDTWSYKEVTSKDYTRSFTSGDQASMLLFLNQDFYTYHADINIMFVIRDGNKNVRNDLVSQTVMDWSDMWNGSNYHYCELNIPKFPTEAGNYSLYLYFNNQAITIIDFTVAE